MRATSTTGILLASIFSLSLSLWGQTFQGGIRGKVADISGAVIGLAKITLSEDGTGISRATVSNDEGQYSFSALNPATYSITVEKPGFKTLQKKGIAVSTQEFLSIDIPLSVGDVSESVNVTEEAPLVETTNASTGQVIDGQKLSDLPNMGRNPFYEGVKISQNVVPGGDPKFNRMEDQSGSSQISIAGGPITGNNYLLDGIAITDSSNHAVIIPSIEAVAEVKLQINTYDAEVGRTGGGTFNSFLKSGTNQLHGSAFGYTWMQPWLANTFFANSAGTPLTNQPFYNYGGSIGGPVIIPKIYNGKNRTFFWITGEGYRQTEAASTSLSVPTALEKVGNFSQSRYTNGSLQTIYNPLSGTPRQPFAGNVIPPSMINATGLALASYYPLPNLTPAYYGATDYNATAIIYDRADQVTTKLDQEIKSWWRASASYLHYGSREQSNAYFGFGNPATPGQSMLVRHVDATQVNTTLTPTPTTVISLRWGFNRYPNVTYQLASQGIDLTKLGFAQSLVSQLPYDAFPAISMSDLASYGAGGYSATHYYSHSFSGSLSKFQGRHNIKTGFDFRAIHVAGRPSVTPGAYSFSSGFSSASGTSNVLGTGAGVASELLGFPSAGSVTTSDNLEDHVDYYGIFIQDDFRVSTRLTLNFGVRYENESGLKSSLNSLIVGFNPSLPNPIQSSVPGLVTNGVVEYAGQSGFGTQATNPNRDKFSPRIGFAYTLDPKTTIRGGYGLLWAPFSFGLYTPIGYTQSTPYVASNDNNVTPAGTISNPFPSGILSPAGNSAGETAGLGGQALSVYSNTAHSTRIHQFSLDIQRELPLGFVVAAGYSGSVTHNLIQGTPGININQLPDADLALGSKLNTKVANPFYGTSAGILNLASPTVAQAQLLLPYPQFGAVTLNSTDQNHARYHSVYAKAQKRLGHGVNVLTTYTWSRNMDASNGASNTFNGQPGTSQDNYNRAAEWSLATINTPGRWTTAVNYELPFGKGRAFLAGNRYLDLAVGGWAVNFQTTMQTGFPLAISQSNLNSSIGTSVQRPNATGVSPETSGSVESRLNSYISPAAFSLAPQYTYGNLSRTITERGPGIANIDFSMFKTYSAEFIGASFKAQFRCEVFNLSNTPQFYGPNTTFGSSTFGQITTQANFPRVFQLGVRFFF
jgi:hypothetical protein